MGDHFVLLVDRLLTESTLEAAIQSRKQGQNGHASASEVETENELSLQKRDFGDGLRKMVECRICHDEDDDSNMETPCSCCGSLKYAHRKCIQRWCNEKGDTVCEICQQQFRPGYTAPPQLFHYGGNPMNFRGNWGISRQDLHDPRFMAMVATDRDFLDVDYDDYSSPSARSMICCRAIAVIFMVLLVLRHALPIIISGDENYSFTLFILLLLRTAGILLPVYIMAQALLAIQRRRQQQVPHELPLTTSDDEENEQLQPQLHLIHVH
ncbi:uncharacterized protein LOC131237702 isoform X2 [Magnolia sinica]|uniref:uncharacterized protein LOC131237702 isoform X2 n=1 Tax=Magnolia sinica TaxID=86752 RepID=UPI00265A468B|nr:uncharacterized protein LOC131237702 isoform X2 [Magnolia sinica]